MIFILMEADSDRTSVSFKMLYGTITPKKGDVSEEGNINEKFGMDAEWYERSYGSIHGGMVCVLTTTFRR